MATNWKEYQEEAAEFFRTLGLEAQTEVSLCGVRTSHDVDVLVRSHHVGFDITWIVECKHWKTRVSKLHVLALREIVTDLGADRGILLSEGGFQSGAIEAATLTNVRVTSLVDVRETAKSEILSMRLRELYDRAETCRERYWNLPKDLRIKYGLRPDVGGPGYSTINMLDLANELLSKAFRGMYPINIESLAALCTPEVPRQFATVEDLVTVLEPVISEVEAKLKRCEAHICNEGDCARNEL